MIVGMCRRTATDSTEPKALPIQFVAFQAAESKQLAPEIRGSVAMRRDRAMSTSKLFEDAYAAGGQRGRLWERVGNNLLYIGNFSRMPSPIDIVRKIPRDFSPVGSASSVSEASACFVLDTPIDWKA
jgi:hypothetical protein